MATMGRETNTKGPMSPKPNLECSEMRCNFQQKTKADIIEQSREVWSCQSLTHHSLSCKVGWQIVRTVQILFLADKVPLVGTRIQLFKHGTLEEYLTLGVYCFKGLIAKGEGRQLPLLRVYFPLPRAITIMGVKLCTQKQPTKLNTVRGRALFM